MEECQYIVVKPHELRKKYTEFVLFNKPRALLPSRKTHSKEGRTRNTRGKTLSQLSTQRVP